ncbi:MAG: calcium-binding protein, partial [Pseudomonadota bacterium]
MPIQNRSTVLSIDDILKSAIVAGAAYSDLTINDTFQERETRLVNSGFFDAQSANNFATEFSLIGSLNDNSPGGTLRTPGLDLYVFQDSADKIYISIDGTEDGRSATPDWIENIHSIVAGGPSIYQPEIENFIKELVDNGTIKPDSVVEIVGHSQGGAQAVFAEGVLRARIGENANTRVVTFNAPGVGGTGGFFADVVDFALGRIPSTILYPSDSGRIFNVTLNNDRVSHFGITRGETITLNAGYNIAQFLSAHSIDNVRNYVASIEANTRGSFGEDAKMVVNFETGAFAWLMPITNPDGSKDVYLVTELGVRENVENDPKLRTLLSQVTDVVRPDVAEQLRLNADPNASVQSSTWTSFLTLPTPNTVTFDLQPISFQQGLNRFDIQKNWATSRANARIGDKVYDLTIYTTAAEDGTALRVTEARDPNNSGAPAFYSQSYTTAAGETVAIVENFEDGTLNEYRRASSGRFGFNSVTSLTENASGDGFERGDTEFNITEIGDAEVIGGDEIGSIFGSTLGRQVAGDSVFTQVAVSSLFAELGERIGLSAEVLLELDDIGLFNALEQAFQEFDSGLFDRVKSQGVGALSSFLTAELLGALGVDGFAGELLNTAGGTALGGILTNFDDIINNTTSIKDVIGPLELGNVVGSFVGGKIAGEIASFDTIGGQLGASLGSAAGTAALGSVFSNAAAAGAANVLGGGSATAFQSFATKLGGLAGPVGAAVGAVAGFLLGGVIGSLFGGTPRSGADVRWRDGEFVVDNVWSRKGGSEEAAESLASQVAGTLNGVLALVGGELLNGEDVTGGTYGMRKKDFTYREAQSREERDIKLKTRDSGAVIKKGSFTALSDFQVAGGDIIGKRAVTSSLALSGETAFSMEALVGDLAVASDYASYLANPSIINSLIASDPDSAFAAGWILTRVRAVELGLHKRAASDWYGGWDVALGVYDGPEGAEYTPGQLSFDLVGKERVTSLVDAGGGFVLGSYGDTIDTAGKDEIAVTGDLTVAGDNGDTIADTAGLTINGEAGVSGQSQTIDVAAVIRGNASDNTIRGGDLGNDIFGGAGDDELRGGKLDDWLFGEAGDDMLYAGDTAEVNAGNAGNGNLLDGGEGDDQLFGGQGSDWLEGGAGTDTLYGGSGDDILAGGADGGSGGGLLLDDAIFSAGLAATTTGDFSLSLDVALASTDQSGYIAHVRREGSNARIIELRYRGNTSFLGVRMSNGPEVGFDVDINDGEVYNIVAVWDHDEADLKLYLNGIEANRRAGSETITPRAPTTTDPMTIGFAKRYNTNFTDVNQFGDESLPSTFYGAKFYDRALTSQEVVDGNSTDGLLNDLEVNANANEVVDRVTQLPAALAERPGNPPGTSYAWVAASDLLDGGDGSDQYLFRSGDGSDVVKEGAAPAPERATDLQPAESLTIAEHIARLSDSGATLNDWRGTSAHETVDLQAAGGDDVLVLGPGIGWENIRMRQAGDDLIISLVERDANDDPIATDDQITLSDWFTSRETRVERLRLADGQEVALGYTNFLYGDDGNNQIYGTAERDFIFGGRGSDEIAALGGADFANGGPDYDFVSGGSDEDLVIGSTGDDILAGDSGTDTVLGGDGDDYVLGNQGDDRIAGGAGADILAGGEGNDTFQYGRGDGNDIVIDTFADGDWVKFWDGDTPSGYSKHDQIIYEGSAADPTQIVYEFGVMHDWIHYNSDGTSAFANNENTIGYYHNVSINSVDDNGTDKIEFDIGIDIADIHMQWDGDDLVLGIGSAAGTSGAFADLTDTITLKDWNAAGKPIEQFQFFHTGIVETSEFDVWGGKGAGPTDGDDTLTGSLVRDWLTGNAGNDDLTGLDGNDILNGNGGQDRLVGGEGEDILFGGAGNDVLEGGAHADILLGGSGLDIASYANALPIPDQSWLGPGIPFTLPGGPLVASLANPSENTGDAESDAYDSIEGLEGSAYDDKLIGDQFDNDIIGGAGNDRLEGGLGGDTYIFGIGDGIDIIADDGGAEDILSFEEGIALSDLSFAYNGNNLVIGYNGGADQITIESFDDAAKQIETLQFADGTSANLAGLRLNGGTDTNQNPTPEELIVGEGALDGGAGNDTLIGRGTNNTLRGGDDNDVLVAGQGVDELDGGAENRDAVTNAPLDGGDWANYTGSNAGIIVDLDGHFSPGVAATGGYAQGDWFTGIESVAGSQFRDEIYGTSGHNVLQGHGGDDKLIGRTGNDILLGGSGVDELKGSNGDDVLDGGAGNDDLLGGRHKDALFGGDGNDRLDGHTEDDVLYGGQGDDRLYGSSGNDQLDGGLGWDRLSAGAGNDILFAGAGGDSLKSGSGEDQFIVQAFGDTITHLENSSDLDTLELIGFDITALTFRLYNGDLQIRDANGGGLNYINWSVGGSGAVSALRSITLDGRVLSAFDLDAALPANGDWITYADVQTLWQTSALYVDNAVYTGSASGETIAAEAPFEGGATFNGLAGDDT